MLESRFNCVLLGLSGHAYVVAEAAEMLGHEVIGYTEFEPKQEAKMKFPYLGFEGDESFWQESAYHHFLLGIGDNQIRQKVFELVKANGAHCLQLSHLNASVSKFATIGEGTVVMRGACINPFANIGKAAIINTSSSVDHDCEIADFVHIAPGAVLCGDVKVGEGSFIGAHSVIKEGTTIGKNVTVGAGSVILRDVPDHTITWGNPAKKVKK